MGHDKVRTTSFRLKPELFGQVYVYEAGHRFNAIWQGLKEQRYGRSYLPYASLAAALSVLSGDFVRLWVKPYFAVSRKRLSPELLSRALNAWEYAIFPEDADGRLADAADDLTESCLHVAERIGARANSCPCPESWVWEVGGWEVAHRLASRPLRTEDKLLRLRLDTGTSVERVGLVTWDQPIEIEATKGGEPARAMIRIQPKLISIPGLSDPVIHLQSSITRLSNKWGGWVKTAWANLGEDHPLLLSGIRHQRIDDGWKATWADETAAVLGTLGLKPLAEASAIDLAQSDLVRARAGTAPAGFPVGKGTGQMFHDAVAVHAQALLEDADPVQLSRAVQRFPAPLREEINVETLEMAIVASADEALRIVCLYATDATRRRMADTIADMLQPGDGEAFQLPADDHIVSVGPFEVLFVSPPGAVEHLMRHGTAADIEGWIATALPAMKHGARGRVAVLAETVAEEDRQDGPGDPKFILRRALAKAGITSQFLSPSSAPDPDKKRRRQGDDGDTDYAAERAAWDLFRSAGVFVRSFPTPGKRIPVGTWALGLFAKDVKQSSKRGPKGASKDSFALSLVAIETGTRQARALQPNGNWAPLGIATAAFLADEKTFPIDLAKEHIESALSRFMAEDPLRKAVLFAEASGCRRFWSGLRDTGDDKLFRAVDTGRLAVVRVRSNEDEVPRPAGVGVWPEDGVVREPSTIEGLLRLEQQDWEGAWYYISASNTMRQMGEHRRHTRFSEDLSRSERRKDWHAFTMTEFWCRRAGPFDVESIYELAARLCREAPTWDGTLNWPSPVHLAKAILADHPAAYFKDFTADGRDATG